jgi:hypothetical protein
MIWIHPTITEKMNGNCHYQECDGRTDGWTDERRTGWTSPYHNTSRFQEAYKNFWAGHKTVNNPSKWKANHVIFSLKLCVVEIYTSDIVCRWMMTEIWDHNGGRPILSEDKFTFPRTIHHLYNAHAPRGQSEVRGKTSTMSEWKHYGESTCFHDYNFIINQQKLFLRCIYM